jgi:hypothetical protein
LPVHGGILAISWQDFLSKKWRIISVHLDGFVNPEMAISNPEFTSGYLELV